jgi:hypothetical protein
MTMPSPDPVTEGGAYQRLLLGLLGSDDPAEVQAASAHAWRELIREAGADLRTRPAEGEWSVVELLGHAMDGELVVSGRYRWILAHDEPSILGYDQDLWVDRLRHRDDEPNAMLALFEALREANLALWRRTPADQRDRLGIHSERGPESYQLTFQLAAGHDRFHLAQARRTLDEVRSAPAGR